MKLYLNDQVYKAVYLTDEEKVVIDALRTGAKVRVNLFDLTYEDTVKFTDELPTGVLPKRKIIDGFNTKFPYITVSANSDDVELTMFVNLRQKNTDRRQAKSVTE